MAAKLALGAVCAASIVASASAAAAKEFVFTGEVWSARTGEPHPDPSALQVELLSRARTPNRLGCDAGREPYERKQRLRVDRSGPGRFTFRVPSSSGACTYEPLNVQFRLSEKDRDLFDPVVAYVVSEDGTLGIHERPWALIATNNREAIERWVTGHGVLRRGTHLVLGYLEPRYTDVVPVAADIHDSRATRFFTKEDAIRSVYWELFFQRRGAMNSLPERLPPVEILAGGSDFLAWTSPLLWQRHAQGQRFHYGGVTDPWAWLVEGHVTQDGGRWKIDLASVPTAPVAAGATPRYAPTKQFFGTEAEGLLARAAAEALLEQARDAVIDADVPDTRDYDLYPRDIHHKGLGRLRELAGDIVVSGSSATLRLRSAREDMTIAHTFRLGVSVSGRRLVFEHPETIAFEYWNMSDRTWGDRICGDRNAAREPFVFNWMTARIKERGGKAEPLARCDPTDARGCRLGVEGNRTWYGRCWWDPAAQDVLLGQLPLPIRRTRYWMVEAAARPDGGRP